jgi:hypothetical protein
MYELAGTTPPVRSRARPDPLHRLKITLAEHYQNKRDRYQFFASRAYDEDLLRFFAPAENGSDRKRSASQFLRSHRTEIRRMVARSTGKQELALDTVLGEMIARARELKLRAVGQRRQLVIDFAILLAARSAEFAYRGRDWRAL